MDDSELLFPREIIIAKNPSANTSKIGWTKNMVGGSVFPKDHIDPSSRGYIKLLSAETPEIS
jgi:hypothetical protein